MISIENVSKSFGGRLLFDDIGFRINARERVGLVGRNGHGKTTLFRMIMGEELPDSGSIVVPKNYRIGMVAQQLRFTETTVLEECMRGLLETERDHHWKAEKILAGLGFSEDDMQRPPGEFSGGYQVRLNLAKVLVNEPDLLLLDEPTNYLDITSIRWITRFLGNWPHEIMLITHDRGFMDRLVTHVVGIHRNKLRKIEGDTGKYYAQIAQDEEIYEKTRLNDEKKRREVELFITRFRAKARLAGLVQSRVKTLAKMEKKQKLEAMATLDFSFRHQSFPGKQMMRVEALSFGYDPAGPPLIRGLDFLVAHGERICVIGPNGMGKTTLLKLLAGNLRPQAGTISLNPNVVTGYYEQTNVQSLVDNRTVETEILNAHPDVVPQKARQICGAMMFSGDDALKPISVLSGGEKSRVMLGKLLATPVNLLLLDEPTNHLDMDSCDALMAAIDEFDGTVIMVTHNEMFLDALAERLLVFQGRTVEVFEGSYGDFLERRGWSREDTGGRQGPRKRQPANAAASVDRKTAKRLRGEIIREKGRVLKPLKDRVQQVERAIGTQETALESANAAMIEASEQQDGARIGEISRQLHECQEHIDQLFGELETLLGEIESHEAAFEARLTELADGAEQDEP